MSKLTYEDLGVEIPPFEAPKPHHAVTYTWWSWHPRSPYWSKSCLKGSTIAKAYEALNSKGASSMKNYHNKLIKFDGIVRTEVADEPCKRLYMWKKIIEADKEKENG